MSAGAGWEGRLHDGGRIGEGGIGLVCAGCARVWVAGEFRRSRNGSRRETTGFERSHDTRDLRDRMTGIQRSQYARAQ